MATATPYLGRTPAAMHHKLHVWERGSDIALPHTSPPPDGSRRPRPFASSARTAYSFRLLRRPVPHVVETYELTATDDGMTFVYTGELGTDGWAIGQWRGNRVAAAWEPGRRDVTEADPGRGRPTRRDAARALMIPAGS